eukprot:14427240-Alexandrium_andersonii.AAC.1
MSAPCRTRGFSAAGHRAQLSGLAAPPTGLEGRHLPRHVCTTPAAALRRNWRPRTNCSVVMPRRAAR